ncbi:MAG: hypothetical protein ACYDFR_03050 [Candidatus Omnitrophota bacterium]
MKRPAGVTIFGMINIVLGILPSLFLINLCLRYAFFITVIFLFTFAGWVTDNEFKSFADWFLLTIVNRGSLITLYIFSLFLSGLAMLKKKPYSRRLAIISISGVVLGWMVSHISSIIRGFLYRNAELDSNGSWKIFYISLALLIYAFLLIKYLIRPEIKEEFNKVHIKYSLKTIIFFTLLVILTALIIFGPLIMLWI